MPVSATEFVARARETDLRIARAVDEHLEDMEGEPLLHLLIFGLGKQAQAAHHAGDATLRDALLGLVDWALRDGDAYVCEAASVSFVEDSGWWEPGMESYLAVWPPALAAELERQRR